MYQVLSSHHLIFTTMLQWRLYYSSLEMRKQRSHHSHHVGELPKDSQLSSCEPGKEPRTKVWGARGAPSHLVKQGSQNPLEGEES